MQGKKMKNPHHAIDAKPTLKTLCGACNASHTVACVHSPQQFHQFKKNSMSLKPFWLINPDDQTIELEFTSKTARDAALKAATRGYTDIYLADVNDGKIHIFGRQLFLRSDDFASSIGESKLKKNYS